MVLVRERRIGIGMGIGKEKWSLRKERERERERWWNQNKKEKGGIKNQIGKGGAILTYLSFFYYSNFSQFSN